MATGPLEAPVRPDGKAGGRASERTQRFLDRLREIPGVAEQLEVWRRRGGGSARLSQSRFSLLREPSTKRSSPSRSLSTLGCPSWGLRCFGAPCDTVHLSPQVSVTWLPHPSVRPGRGWRRRSL